MKIVVGGGGAANKGEADEGQKELLKLRRSGHESAKSSNFGRKSMRSRRGSDSGSAASTSEIEVVVAGKLINRGRKMRTRRYV